MRIRVIGCRDGRLPVRLWDKVERAVVRTRGNRRLTFTVALNYGGRAEIVAAARALAAEAASGRLAPEAIDEATFRRFLYTNGTPDPDLIIRTGGEWRLSNFLLWQLAYAELWVTPTCWPDFDKGELVRAVREYQRRERRWGGRANGTG